MFARLQGGCQVCFVVVKVFGIRHKKMNGCSSQSETCHRESTQKFFKSHREINFDFLHTRKFNSCFTSSISRGWTWNLKYLFAYRLQLSENHVESSRWCDDTAWNPITIMLAVGHDCESCGWNVIQKLKVRSFSTHINEAFSCHFMFKIYPSHRRAEITCMTDVDEEGNWGKLS